MAGGSIIAGAGIWAIKEIAIRNTPESLTGEVVAGPNGANVTRVRRDDISSRIMSNLLQEVYFDGLGTTTFRVPDTDIAYRGYAPRRLGTFDLILRKYAPEVDTESPTEAAPTPNAAHFAEEYSPQELDVSLDVIDGMVTNAQYEPAEGAERVRSGFVMKMTGVRTVGNTKYAVMRLIYPGSLAQDE
jgi:hypothetical protein